MSEVTWVEFFVEEPSMEIAVDAGLTVKSRARPNAPFQVLTRIAVEELEAWLLGDVPALLITYPGVSPTLANQKTYRDVDKIKGGTWEALERALGRTGYAASRAPWLVCRTDDGPARSRLR